jgi:uncharacterized GH25 family protein
LLLLAGACPAANQCQATDEFGYPLADVTIARLEPNELQLPPCEEQWTTLSRTTDEGLFFAAPTTSRTLLILSKKDRVTVALDGRQALPQSVALAPHAEIGGWLYDDKGTTVLDAQIGPVLPITKNDSNASPDDLPPVPPIYGHTDQNGFFRIGGLAPGQYSFQVQAPGLCPEIGFGGTGVLTSVSLSTKGTTYTGVLLGSRDHLPQPDMIVEASAGMIRVYATTDQKGEFVFPALQNAEWKFNSSPSAQQKVKATKVVQNGRGENTRDLVLLHNQGVSIAGRFLDAETSEPVANLSLRMNTYEGDSPATTVTDANGGFRFDKVDAWRNVSLAFDGERYAFRSRQTGQWGDRISISTQPGIDITTITVPLIPRAVVTGRVLGPGNRAVPGADVVLRNTHDADQGYEEMRRPSVFSTKSNPAGQFKLPVFPAGEYEVRASVPLLGMQAINFDASSTSPRELMIHLQPLIQLHGRTETAQGKPLAGARVEVTGAAGGNTSATESLLGSAKSDARGRFDLEGVFPPDVVLTASHSNYDATVTTRVAVLATNNPLVEMAFPSLSEFSVHVITQSGTPVEGAHLQLFPVEELTDGTTSTKALNARTNFDGRAVFMLDARRINKLVVRHTEYALYTAENLQLPLTNYEIKLTQYPSVSVAIKIPEGSSEESLKAVVYLLRADAPAGGGEPALSQYRSIRQQGASFGKALFENCEPGWYKAAMQTDTDAMYSESAVAQLKPDGDNLLLHLESTSGASITGKVTDAATGDPIAGAEVHIQLQGGTPTEFEVVSKPTDAQGRYSIAAVPAAHVVLSATHPDYSARAQVMQLPASGQVIADCRLGKEATLLSGQVTVDGKPLPDATLVVYKNEDMGQWIGSAVTDAHGMYNIEGVPEGSRLLIAEALWGTDAKGLRKRQLIMVKGRTSRADVEFRGLVRVHGRIQQNSAALDPAAKNTLFFASKINFGDLRRLPLPPTGEYEVYLEPGPYTISLTEMPGPALDVPEGADEVTANFEFDDLAQSSGLNARPAPQLE